MTAPTVVSIRPLTDDLHVVTYSMPARRARTSMSGQPLIGGGAVDYTHVGEALVGTKGAVLLENGPPGCERETLCADIFRATREQLNTEG
jgi:hypothetical protein